jgi:hypothetical protein
MAGAKPIGIKIGEITQVYRATHNAGQDYQEYGRTVGDTRLASSCRLIIEESKESETYPIEIYTTAAKLMEK